ncbi:VWA domain-containing protein [Novipirellula sp.]|uniref:vWA domain-containing protein n=1 Tax=Novipirellula sp. TaxID=2795430 RepID=UPI003566349D
MNSAQPGQSNVYGTGTTSGVQVPHVALGWEIVRPAGAGPTDWLPAISTSVSAADDNGDADSGNRLELGVLRSSLQTGPKNLLILPPDVASVVYVLDCSSSMTGKRFAKVQSAIVDAVSQMNAKQMFALLLFNTEALQICGGGYRNAGAAGAAVLAQELTMIAPSGGTNPSNALLLAIQLKPDAVVILSDGEFETSIVERVTQLNRRGGKNTQINCVAIGSQVVTLQKLATLNGPGNYVEVP